MGANDPLSAEELAAVDATYEPIPSFVEWPQEIPRPELWDRARSELDSLKASALSNDVLEFAVRTAVRVAAFDTGAIEGLYKTDRGLTMTVATQAATWQATVDAREPDARSYFEAQLEAYELVMDVVTDSRPVTEVWIRHLHEVLTRPQDTYTVQTLVGPQERPLPRGRYKPDPNHVRLGDDSIHPYAPVESTPPEMARLINEMGSEAFAAAHPVAQASYVHYCLAAIHPFADGNGRVARAVASTYLYRAASVPLLILADQRIPYFRSLEDADRGNRAPFILFVATAARSAVGMVIEAMRTALAPQSADALNILSSLLSAQGGLMHEELDAVGNRLQEEVQSLVSDVFDAIELPPGVSKSLGRYGGPPRSVPTGYRAILSVSNAAAGGSFRSSPPAHAAIDVSIQIAVSISNDEAETFVLFDRLSESPDDGDKLVLGLLDVYPEMSAAAQFRIRAYVERLVGTALANLAAEASEKLGQAGYRVEGNG